MGKLTVACCLVFLIGLVSAHEGSGNTRIGLYEIKRGNFSVTITNVGAAIVSVLVPDKNGNLADIVLGFDTAEDYLQNERNFGAIIGRVANRIAGAQFTLNGEVYKLEANQGNNTLNGGSRGFSHVIWEVIYHQKTGVLPRIDLKYESPDGEGGFPGNVIAEVSYRILEENQLNVQIKARTLNKPTPVNIAPHSYWNLGGHNSGNILSHELQIFGSHITPVESNLIPTGQIVPVNGTPYDFLQPRAIETGFKELPRGYDINYVLDGGHFGMAAVLYERNSGRVLEMRANTSGLQFYSGHGLKDVKGKGRFVYQALAGLCLESQGFPDAVNHPSFPSQIITKGKPYSQFLVYKFSTRSSQA